MNKTIRTLTAMFAFALATVVGSSALAATPAQLGVDATEDVRFDAAVLLEGQVNLNTASQVELELLPGIGPSIAARIISYRETHPFQQRNNIMRIRGIGQKTFAKIKDYLVVEGETTLRVAG